MKIEKTVVNILTNVISCLTGEKTRKLVVVQKKWDIIGQKIIREGSWKTWILSTLKTLIELRIRTHLFSDKIQYELYQA